jgi:hypothetical protein
MEQVNFPFSCHFLAHIVRKNVTPYKGTRLSKLEYQKAKYQKLLNEFLNES